MLSLSSDIFFCIYRRLVRGHQPKETRTIRETRKKREEAGVDQREGVCRQEDAGADQREGVCRQEEAGKDQRGEGGGVCRQEEAGLAADTTAIMTAAEATDRTADGKAGAGAGRRKSLTARGKTADK